MHKITKLPDHIQKIICAGEVITSPYNVLKELIENSIDAEASTIKIMISKDMLNIEVHDNGKGINEEDFDNLCKSHHTSKFNELLNFNNFFGFRGEALASICCVSNMNIKSKKKDSIVGFMKECRENKIVSISMNDGTSVIIKHLFYNNKLREKCYTKNINEYKKCLELIYSFIIKYFYIRFYINDVYVGGNNLNLIEIGKNTENFKINDWCVDGNNLSEIDKNIENKFDVENFRNFREYLENTLKAFIYLSSEEDKIKSQVISTIYKIEKTKQYSNSIMSLIFTPSDINFKKYDFILFVNNRIVSHSNIKDAIYKKYQYILPKHRYPFVYLELKIPNQNIDVNVHPSKKEVLFDYEDLLIEIITQALEIGLNEKRKFIQLISKNKLNSPLNIIYKMNDSLDEIVLPTKLISENTLSEENILTKKFIKYNLKSIDNLKEKIIEIDSDFIRNFVYIGIFSKKYLLVQYDQYLMKTDLSKFISIFLYQYLIFNFGNFKSINTNIKINSETKYKEMLNEYFSIKIENKIITEIPVIGTYFNEKVDEWNNFKIESDTEESVLEEVINQLVYLYREINIDKIVFSICKRCMKSTKELMESFSTLTNLKDLYKKFERC